MRLSTLRAGHLLGPAITIGIACCLAKLAPAQSERPREHIILPPAFAGTPLSLQIQAEAQYLTARSDLAESVAIARKIHADAFAQEIDNSVAYVDAYFRRRELNRQWRAKENPNRVQREAYRQEVRKQRIEGQIQDILKSGDVTDNLNWLLVELSGPAAAHKYYVRYGKEPLDSVIDQPLAAEDVSQIWLSDSRRQGSGLVFRAVDPKVLETLWPLILRASQFDSLRADFAVARDRVVKDVETYGEVRYESAQKLVRAVNDLLVGLEKGYPKKERKKHVDFYPARRYLRSLTAQVHRAIHTSDSSVFEGTLRFEGHSVMDLIEHMNRRGLVFASPRPGGERVYAKLLLDMKGVYSILHQKPWSGKSEAS